jgi:putative transposase
MSDPEMETFRALERLSQRGSTAQKIALRCKIILTYQKRKHVALVAQDLGCNPLTVRKWIGRWNKAIPAILEKWDSKSFNREKAILATLQDAPRCGTPATYSPEQIAEIIALACRKPQKFGRPITHWTIPELVDEIVKQGIADKISETTVRRFLKSGHIATAQKPQLAQSQKR